MISINKYRENEVQFTMRCIQFLKLKGWTCCHFRTALSAAGRHMTALHGDPGCPDIIAVRNGETLFLELKVGRNKLSPAQTIWRSHINTDNYMLLYPEDFPKLMERAA